MFTGLSLCDPMDSTSLQHNFSHVHRWQRHYAMITLDSWEPDSVSSNPTLPMHCKFLMCLCMNSPTAAFFDIWTLPISGDCMCPDYKFSTLFISLQELRLEHPCFIHGNLPLSCFQSNAASSLQKAQFTQRVHSRACPTETLHIWATSPSPATLLQPCLRRPCTFNPRTQHTHVCVSQNKTIIQKDRILPFKRKAHTPQLF